MKQGIVIFISIVLLSGCASKTVLINEEYTEQMNTKKEMVIFPVFYDSLIVINWNDVVDDFKIDSSNYKSFIYDTLCKSLLINSKSLTRDLAIVNGNGLLNWEEMRKDTNNYFVVDQLINDKYEASFQVPKKDYFKSPNYDSYALIIKKIIISRDIEKQTAGNYYVPGQTVSTPAGTTQTPGTVGTSSFPGPNNYFEALTEFIIWDYENNDFVKCGVIKSKKEFSSDMGMLTWLFLFEKITTDLFKDTPFEVLKYY